MSAPDHKPRKPVRGRPIVEYCLADRTRYRLTESVIECDEIHGKTKRGLSVTIPRSAVVRMRLARDTDGQWIPNEAYWSYWREKWARQKRERKARR